MEDPMDTAAYKKFTTSAADIAKTVVEGQVQLFDLYAKTAEGTPASQLFSAVATMQRAALEGIEKMSDAVQAEPSKAKAKKAAKAAAEPLKATAAAVKKAVDAQADMMVGAGASTVAATSKTKDAVAKAAKSATSGDMAALYDDLTEVTGIGPATMKKLQSEGVRTISDLAKISSKDLGDIIEKASIRTLKYTPADWIADAKGLLKAAKAA